MDEVDCLPAAGNNCSTVVEPHGKYQKGRETLSLHLVEHIQSKKALQFRVTINDVVDGVSNENCNNITQRYLRKFCPGSQKSFKSFMQQAIKIAATNAPVCEVTGAVGLRRGRTGKRRHFSLDVDKRILGFPLSQE